MDGRLFWWRPGRSGSGGIPTLLTHEHPRGAKRFLGPQLSYLIHRDHGCLGAAGLAAAVRRLAAWMDWSEDESRRPLHRILGLNRRLIRGPFRNRPRQVRRRVAADFAARYHFRPGGWRPWWTRLGPAAASRRRTWYRSGPRPVNHARSPRSHERRSGFGCRSGTPPGGPRCARIRGVGCRFVRSMRGYPMNWAGLHWAITGGRYD